MSTLDQAVAMFAPPVAPCGDAFPPNRHLTCVRVPGHPGRHVWISDSERATASSTQTWRDHAEECSCCYCVDSPAARAAAEAAAP